MYFNITDINYKNILCMLLIHFNYILAQTRKKHLYTYFCIFSKFLNFIFFTCSVKTKHVSAKGR